MLSANIKAALCLAILTLSSSLSLVTAPVAFAQTTMLTGSAYHNDNSRPLVKQTAVMDRQVVTRSAPPVYRAAAAQQHIAAVAPKTVYVDRPVYRNVYVKDNRTFFQRHPKVKAATIGAGVGTAAGAVTGLVSGRGVVRGGVIGAGTGAGVGLVRSSNTLKRHPIMRDVSTGTLVGLGLGAASSRRSKRAWQGAGVGAAAGLGWGLLKHGLR